MKDYVNEWLLLTRDVTHANFIRDDGKRVHYSMQKPRDHLTLKSGLQLSIQASVHTYCTPKNDDGPWTHVEVMVKNDSPPHDNQPIYEWREYYEPSGGIYGYLPVELVNKLIEEHGGVGDGTVNR